MPGRGWVTTPGRAICTPPRSSLGKISAANSRPRPPASRNCPAWVATPRARSPALPSICRSRSSRRISGACSLASRTGRLRSIPPRARAHLWQAATALLPRKDARAHNSALMDLGALVCVPRQPRCGECPVRSHCRAEQPELLPVKRKRPRTVALFEPHAFARRRNRILLEQSSDRWRGMWILPRLARSPREDPLLQIDFPFTHHRVTLAVFAGRGIGAA